LIPVPTVLDLSVPERILLFKDKNDTDALYMHIMRLHNYICTNNTLFSEAERLPVIKLDMIHFINNLAAAVEGAREPETVEFVEPDMQSADKAVASWRRLSKFEKIVNFQSKCWKELFTCPREMPFAATTIIPMSRPKPIRWIINCIMGTATKAASTAESKRIGRKLVMKI
jgi:hypothetical protein